MNVLNLSTPVAAVFAVAGAVLFGIVLCVAWAAVERVSGRLAAACGTVVARLNTRRAAAVALRRWDLDLADDDDTETPR